MKNILTLLMCAAILPFAHAQQTENRNLSSFRGVKVSQGIDVYLKKGDKESARLEVTGTSSDNVVTEVVGSYLKIHMKEGRFRDRTVKVYVTYVEIDKLSASSSGNIYSEDVVKTDNLEVSTSSAATIEVAVDVNFLEASASSAGQLDLKGKAKSFTADAASAGEIDAYDVDAETVNAEASSGSTVKVSVTKELNAHASSGGGVRYRGNPSKSITESSSGGSVRKSN